MRRSASLRLVRTLSLKTLSPLRPGRRRDERAFSLVEVAVGMGLITMTMLGIIAALLQSRRLTESSIGQNAVVTVVQGYLEQMKNMEFASLPYTSGGTVYAGGGATAAQIPTRLNESTTDPLTISTGAIPAMSAVTWANGLSGVVDNNRTVDINQTLTNTADDLPLKLWVWIQDVSDASVSATQVRAITIIYQWQVKDGSRIRILKASVRTIRSSVPTF